MARIIHVGDDEPTAEAVRQALGMEGHAVSAIHHGTLAFDTIAFRRPDLVILDLSLPGVRSMDMVRALRRLPALDRTPVLCLSGEAAATDAGTGDRLEKPFAAEDLVRQVAEMLRDSDLRREVERSS